MQLFTTMTVCITTVSPDEHCDLEHRLYSPSRFFCGRRKCRDLYLIQGWYSNQNTDALPFD